MVKSTYTTRKAFTLIEILIAASIFAVGLVAVAAIFPTAIQLQKQTFEEIRGDEFSKTVKALVLQKGFDRRVLAARSEAGHNTATTTDDLAVPRIPATTTPLALAFEPPTVFSAPAAVDPVAVAPPSFPSPYDYAYEGWGLADRSSGSLEPARATSSTEFEYGGRTLFWTPLFIDYDSTIVSAFTPPGIFENRRWGAFVFVLRSDPGSSYGRVVSGDVIGYALNAGVDRPQDASLTAGPTNVFPGVARVRVAVASPDRFNFTNQVAGTPDPIVRVGDQVLAEDGRVYDVIAIDAAGVRVATRITDRPAPAAVEEIWVAHPGNSGESSFVRIISLINQTEVNNLVR